jgi:phosphoglycerate dehydrogenase-like enzyme
MADRHAQNGVYHVFVMGERPPAHRELMQRECPPGYQLIWQETEDPAEVTPKLALADFVICPGITSAQIAQAPNLKLIQMLGVGYDRIDVAAAQARGIPVTITPESTSEGVAEHTVLLILALYKHLVDAHLALRQGRWIRAELRPDCFMLQGKRVGIVGLGRIGREVAKRLAAFGVDLVYHDVRRLSGEDELALGLRFLPLDELLRTSDVVTLHVFLAAGSRELIGPREIALMQPSAILVNTCRGGVVGQDALVAALRERRIAGAGLDVFAAEPVPAGDPLLQLDNVILTPHMSAHTRDALVIKTRACFANFQRVLDGEAPRNTFRPYAAVLAPAGP